MSFEFEFSGGSCKPSPHSIEKFYVFFVINGNEMMMQKLIPEGLVHKNPHKLNHYVTDLQIGKIFTLTSGFGSQKLYHSFYFRLYEETEMVTVKGIGDGSAFYMKARMKFLSRTQVLELLSAECDSRRYVREISSLPKAILDDLITVEQVQVKKVRFVRIGERVTPEPRGIPMEEED